MEQSEEVRGFLASLIGTFGTPQMRAAFTDALSADPGVLIIGSDPAEWWDRPDDLRRAVETQSEELQGLTVTVSHSEGWVEGGIGWAAARADVALAEGQSVGLRITATLARRNGGWKIVQAHISVGVANEEVVGKELTV
jgi:SnoaL-like protein